MLVVLPYLHRFPLPCVSGDLMADRRRLVANTALLAAFASVVASIWFYSLNPRVNEVVRRGSKKTIADLGDVSFLEIYLFYYSALGGTAFFMFFTVWLSVARRDRIRRRFPSPFVWWLAVVSFVIYLPTVLLPLSIVGIWALFTPETKMLIYNLPWKNYVRPDVRDDSGNSQILKR